MINPECPICFGIGWVCENHPNRAWDEQKGCQCGAGMPCQCVRVMGLVSLDFGLTTVQLLTNLRHHAEGSPLPRREQWARQG